MKTGLLNLFSIFFILFIATSQVSATHVQGSDFSWTCIGKDSFKITVRVYRDCNGVSLGSTPITIRSTGCSTRSLATSRTLVGDLTPVCDAECTRCSSKGCSFKYGIEVSDLSAIVDLSDYRAKGCCKLDLSWAQCCRNSAITTGARGQGFHTTAMMNVCLDQCDNAPKWIGAPIAMLCQGRDFIYNHGAYDVDYDDSTGQRLDSLVYSMDEPLADANTATTWNGKYSHQAPIAFLGFPVTSLKFPRGFHLDSTTGDLMFRPMKEEVSVMTIKVEEYRSGKKIGEVRRDIQVIVIRCPTNNPPIISDVNCKTGSGVTVNLEGCVGDEIEFDICTSDKEKNDTITLRCITDLPKGASFSITNPLSSRPIGRVKWKLDSVTLLNSPYILSFEARDDNCPINAFTSRNIRIFINSPGAIPTAFHHKIIDTTCGKLALWGGSTDTLVNTEQYWYVNDTLNGSGDSVTYNISSRDTQFVKVLLKRSGCFHVFYDTIVPPALNPIHIKSILDTTLCAGSLYEQTIVANGGAGGYTYKWSATNASLLANTSDSVVKIRPSFKPAEKTVLELTVTDSVGCEMSRRVELDVLESIWKDLVSDTLICRNDSFSLKLPRYQDSFGRWEGPGVTQDRFRSSKLLDGVYSLKYETPIDGYCVLDTAQITFSKVPYVQLDSLIETCFNHVNIPLSASPFGGTWSGDGIVNDSFFRLTTTVKGQYPIKYKYVNALGCADSAFVKVDIGVVGPELFVGPDTVFCQRGPEMKVRTNATSGSWLTNAKMIKTVKGEWFIKESALQFGDNEAVFIGTDSNYCRSQDTLKIKYQSSPNVMFSVSKKTLCVTDDSFEIKITPDTATVIGDSIVWSNGKAYFVPTRGLIGSHQYEGFVVGANGCKGTSNLQVILRDTFERSYKADTTLCVGQSIELKDLADSGYWTTPKNLVRRVNGKWTVLAKSIHLGKNQITYLSYKNDKCYSFDTSTIFVVPSPSLSITSKYQVCITDTLTELKSATNGTKWSGKGVVEMAGKYYVDPAKLHLGTNFVHAEVSNSNGCTKIDSALVDVKDIPRNVQAGTDATVCLEKDSITYPLTNSIGQWQGHGVRNGRPFARFKEVDAQKTYQYVVTETNSDGCANSDTMYISLGRKMSPNFSADVTSGRQPLKVKFKDLTPNAVHRKWYFGNGDSATNVSEPICTYKDTGDYSVRLIVADSMKFCGATVVKNDFVTVIYHNSIEEGGQYFEIFPNPVNDELSVQTDRIYEDATYKILDMSGKAIEQGAIRLSNVTKLNVQGLHAGTYLLELSLSNGSSQRVSFVKE